MDHAVDLSVALYRGGRYAEYARAVALPVPPREGLCVRGLAADRALVGLLTGVVLDFATGRWEASVTFSWGGRPRDPHDAPADAARRLGPEWELVDTQALAPRRVPADLEPPF